MDTVDNAITKPVHQLEVFTRCGSPGGRLVMKTRPGLSLRSRRAENRWVPWLDVGGDAACCWVSKTSSRPRWTLPRDASQAGLPSQIEGGLPTEPPSPRFWCPNNVLLVACPVTSTSSPHRSVADSQRSARTYRRATKDIRGRGADERRTVRQQNSRQIVDALEPWLRAKLGLFTQKSKLAEAVRYTLSGWEGA